MRALLALTVAALVTVSASAQETPASKSDSADAARTVPAAPAGPAASGALDSRSDRTSDEQAKESDGAETPRAAESQAPAAEASEAKVLTSDDPAFQKAASRYRKVHRDGETLYCRREKELGTRLAEQFCFTEAQLIERVRRSQEAKNDMHRPRGGPCGSNC